MNSPFNNRKPAIATQTGIHAAQKALELAKEKGLRGVICGGLAMHLYGFTRATSDIDIISTALLDQTPLKPLTFGGAAYLLQVDGTEVEVDWIVREDQKKPFYLEALEHVLTTDDNLPILAPEMLVIIKHLAGRGKDHMDCLWLLRQDDLVDRGKMFDIVRKVMGDYAFWAIQDLESLILEADLMKARDGE